MKKFFIAVALLVAGSAAHAQSEPNVQIDNAGNYVALERSAQKDTANGRFYVDNDNLWPVYQTRQGKLYALCISNAGKTYRYDLVPVAGSAAHAQSKPNVQIDNAGNYFALERSGQKDTATDRFYVDKDDNLWPVFRTRQGKLYALCISKAGKTYRYYIEPNTTELDFETE